MSVERVTAYNIFRWYRGGWGRYTQPDPLGVVGGGEANAYAYAADDPIENVDPAGLASGSCCNQDFLTCLDACVKAGDPFSGAKKLPFALGVPIPKFLVRAIGMRTVSMGPGTSPLTTPPSIVSNLCRLGARNPLRTVGRVMQPAFITYGAYLAALEIFCSAECAKDHCFIMQGCI